jgi:hypothetical protein
MITVKRHGKQIWPVMVHILVWVLFLSLPAMFKPRPPGEALSLSMVADDLLILPRWANSLLLISVFYFNYYFAIPKLYIRYKYWQMLVSVFVCFGLFILLNLSMAPNAPMGSGPGSGHHPPGGFFGFGNSFNLFMFLIVYVSSFALCLYDQWQSAKEQMLTTQISFLKAQINPHFLFNTLNSIYSLTLAKSDNAPDAVIKLSGMMRYSVSEATQTYVSLAKEIDYISNYIDLQKLRLADKIRVSYVVSGDAAGKQIAPFLLIPFVENAFKYGVNAEENSDIRIRIEITDSGLQMLVSNNKVYMRPDIDKGTGLGINTTRQRLALMYPGEHVLSVDDGVKDFKVLLQITIK